ncbi:MAG: hypothetical protein AB8G99_06980 [Planctomycetaceae bacterium]
MTEQTPIDESVSRLYQTFRRYRLGSDFAGCNCCVSPADHEPLRAKPLRALSFDDLQQYSTKAMTTWGDISHFKHFLPRLMELTIGHRDEFLDLAVVFGKLSWGNFETWPEAEATAVHRFLAAYWRFQLSQPISAACADATDTVLCSLGNAVSTVQPYLDEWTKAKSQFATLHLASFVLANSATLLKKGQLWNPFWDKSAQPHREVVAWLKAAELVARFEQTQAHLTHDFEYALPQLNAIRAVLNRK